MAESEMRRFGLLGSFRAHPEQGEALAELLLQAADALASNPDCEMYLISQAAEDPELLWVSEVWVSRDAHAASLEDERVRGLVAQARPLIADHGQRYELKPLGGKGLS